MAIDTSCTGCGKALRVGDEHAGKRARCPACGAIYTVPGADPPPDARRQAAASRSDDDHWYMKTPEGQIYGPVDKEKMDQWLAEGRVTNECLVRAGEQGTWQAADEYYGVLRPQAAAASPYQPATHTNYRPAQQPTHAYAAAHSNHYTVPHRGAIILVLGILGWVFSCPIFSVAAWVMGSSDLREIRAGRMDQRGTGLTQAGQVLGMIYSLIWIIIFVIAMFVLILAAAGSAF